MKICILGALDEEIDGIRAALENRQEKKAGAFSVCEGTVNGNPLVLCRCGIGKVNAAAAASAILTAYRDVDAVLNTGVAGGVGKGLSRGDVVLGERTVQHDFDSTPDGDRPGQVAGFDSEFFPADPALLSAVAAAFDAEGIAYRRGTVASGDQFIADSKKAAYIRDTFGADACEMESGAIAQVCALFGVPFLAVRAISDNGDEEALGSFYEFLHEAAEKNIRALLRYLREL